jgi:hypothetical protein
MAVATEAPLSLQARLLIAVLASLLNTGIYLLANHLSWRPARSLLWTRVDAAVPFIPETIWIYGSDYLLIASAFVLVARTRREAWHFARGYLLMVLLGPTVHLAWPTVFPRELFPLTGEGTSIRCTDRGDRSD